MPTNIEWTQDTWNPIGGCEFASPGCINCYALTMSNRLQANPRVNGYNGTVGKVPKGGKLMWTGRINFIESALDKPYKFKKPRLFFVCSMSDLFHSGVPDLYLDRIFKVIEATPQHKYQILTKRPERMLAYFDDREVPDNAWLGVSVENQQHGVPRIDLLRQVPCDKLFLSCEPLLGDLGELDLTGIGWVIVGGEAGSQARAMQLEWVLAIQHQCQQQQVAFFFKQWGAWGVDGELRSKKDNGRLLNGHAYDEVPAGWVA